MPEAPHPIDEQAKKTAALVAEFGKQTTGELRAMWTGRLRSFWRLTPELYRLLARRLVDLGENFLALEVIDERDKFFGADPQLVYWAALALARSGATEGCQALLDANRAALASLPDYPMLRARLEKDRWRRTGERRFLAEALRLYDEVLNGPRRADSYYPEVNAATTALLLGEDERAQAHARRVLAALAAGAAEPWEAASLAEAHLVLGDGPAAWTAYARFVNGPWPEKSRPGLASRLTTRAQARLVLACRRELTDKLEAIFKVPAVGGLLTDGGPADPAAAAWLAEIIRDEGIGSGFVLGGGPLAEAFLRAFARGEARALDPEPAESDTPEGLRRQFDHRLLLGRVLQLAAEMEVGAHLFIAAPNTEEEAGMAARAGVKVHRLLPAGAASPAILAIGSCTTAPGENDLFSVLHVALPSSVGETAVGELGRVFADLAKEPRDAGLRLRTFGPGELRAYLTDPASALALAAQFAAVAGYPLGLHAGPMRIGVHPATGRMEAMGRHATRGGWLVAAATAERGQTLASAEFVALARTAGVRGWRFEYLGRRTRGEGGETEAVFRVLAG